MIIAIQSKIFLETDLQTLLIDNYDSFTYNLYQLISLINGQEPLILKNDTDWEVLAKLYQQQAFDNILISPGPGNPQCSKDCGINNKIAKEIPVPILGVCLGHQTLGYCFGARVIRAPEVFHGRSSEILHHTHDPLFTKIPNKFTAIRYHSLVLAKPLPPCLIELACTEDKIPMAIRHKALPIWGVQFHPESILSEYGEQLLENFKNITQTHHKPT